MNAKLDFASLNARHVSRSDKFFRMFAGAASFLQAFDAGILHLDIRVDNRLRDSPGKIADAIARSWHRPEIAHPQPQELGTTQPGFEAQDKEGAVAPRMTPAEVLANPGNLIVGKWSTTSHGDYCSSPAGSSFDRVIE